MEAIVKKLNTMAEKVLSNNKGKPFSLTIHSPKYHLDYTYPSNSDKVHFHIASISKLITTTALLKLVEEGLCQLEDPLVKYLDPKRLEGLFLSPVETITIADCLTHRSGAADYFEGKDKTGKPFLDIVVKSPDTYWSQDSILDFAKYNLKPLSFKGEKFAYGDTAFLCVMMVIEKITGLALPQALEKIIFKPLDMKNSQAMIYTYDKGKALSPLPIYIGDVDVRQFNSLSCDQADGGIVSTPLDLILFQKALHNGFINSNHLQMMQNWQGKFRAGIHYGMGMMQIRFEEFFFLMRNYPRLVGHIGVLSTHAYYDAENDVYYVLNFGSTKNMTKSFTFLSQLVGYLTPTLKKLG